jgi:hypothetical protein
MTDRKTKVLLSLLAAALAIVAVGIVLSTGLERLVDARAAAERYEMRIAKLRKFLPTSLDLNASRDALRKEIAATESRFYSVDEMNPYSFGAVVKRKITSLGINVQRYQVIDVKGTSYVEFSAYGKARSFVTFLRDVSESEKMWTIPSMSMTLREGSDIVDAVLRIGYAVVDSKSR